MKSFGVVLLCWIIPLVVGVQVSQSIRVDISQPNRRIDTHSHFIPPFYRDLLKVRNLDAGGRGIPPWDVSAHLALNKQIGVVTSILSVSTPGAKLTEDSPIEEGRTLARQLNEYAYNVTQQYPDTFLFFATLTLPDVEGAVAEAIYSLDTLKAAGVIVMASTFGELFGSSRYASLYEVLNKRNATVFIHPGNTPFYKEMPATKNSTNVPAFVIDFLLDTSRAAVNLVYRNVIVDYPNINFILAHSGGLLPFAATRAAGALGLVSGVLNSKPLYYEKLQKFYVDVAISATMTALPSSLTFFGSTHMTFGSDFPFAPFDTISQNTEDLLSFDFHEGGKANVDFLNACKLIGDKLIDCTTRRSRIASY